MDVSETAREAAVDVMGVLGWGGFGDKFNLGIKREFQTGAARHFFQLNIYNCFRFEFSGMHCLIIIIIFCNILNVTFLMSFFIQISVS